MIAAQNPSYRTRTLQRRIDNRLHFPRDLARAVRVGALRIPLAMRLPIVVHLRAAHARAWVTETTVDIRRRRAGKSVAHGRRSRVWVLVNDRAGVGRGREGLRVVSDLV